MLAALGTWISNPFTYVPLYWFNYRIGSLLLNKDKTLVDFSHINADHFWSQGWYVSSRLIIGSTVVGMISSLIGGFGLYLLIKKTSTH